MLFLIYAVFARAKGQAVSREDVHDAWVTWMAAEGESHESMRAFGELEPSVQAEDNPFVAAIRPCRTPRPFGHEFLGVSGHVKRPMLTAC